jgi:hypothetical protein
MERRLTIVAPFHHPAVLDNWRTPQTTSLEVQDPTHMAKLKLNDVELKMLDLMIAVKKDSEVKKFDFISDIFDVLDAVGNVTEVAVAVTEAGGAVLVDALKRARKPRSGISLDALLKIRKEAAQKSAS